MVVDDKEYGQVTAQTSTYPWDYDERLLLDLTLVGNLGSKIEKSGPLVNLLVDFIRVKPFECE